MKAVIYARFSSDKQNEDSIEDHLRECMQGCRIITRYKSTIT